MAGHPSGDPKIVREHIEKQRKGDQELSESAGPPPEPRDDNRRTRDDSPGVRRSEKR
jgi:hypothetical protein